VVLSRTAPQTAHLNLPGRAGTVDWIL
jgi:hypothetical protein